MTGSWITDDLAKSYSRICKDVYTFGRETSPRGHITREVLDAHIQLTNPRNCLPVGTGRKLHTGVGSVEAMQLIAGESWPQLMTKVTGNFANFMNGEILHGAYGPRVGAQIHNVLTKLEQDPDTRQAVINIFDGSRDHIPGIADVPCTVALQFTVRDNHLNMHVRMRSNDIWWGLPYDVFQFCQLQIHVAEAFGYQLGSYFHTATSLHVYERDFDKVHQLTFGETPRNSMWRYALVDGGAFATQQRAAHDVLSDLGFAAMSNAAMWHKGAIHRD